MKTYPHLHPVRSARAGRLNNLIPNPLNPLNLLNPLNPLNPLESTKPFVNNNSVIVVMNKLCFATKRMSGFLPTLNLSGFFGVLVEIKKKMLNLRYNL